MSENVSECGCGARCMYADTEGEPCWGDILIIDEIGGEGYWVHACEGHADCYDSAEPYKPQPSPLTGSNDLPGDAVADCGGER